MIFFLEKKLIYSSARLYYIARFTEATVTDPYQTSREWGLQKKKIEEGGGGFWAHWRPKEHFSVSWSLRRVPRFI